MVVNKTILVLMVTMMWKNGATQRLLASSRPGTHRDKLLPP